MTEYMKQTVTKHKLASQDRFSLNSGTSMLDEYRKMSTAKTFLLLPERASFIFKHDPSGVN